ncbi:glycosyltransferase [Granulicella sp. dw_53]|uniref:glycosyltransferase n=1 Tax=Granulicella sp. dw_53 TaxID=2719792 RepID=UPI001BD4D404|nr:glycosyltransferase [Granulicella sp. dw_53]
MSNLIHELELIEQYRAMDDLLSPSSRWLQVLSHLDPKYGGLSAVVPQLSSKLALGQDLSISIAGFCRQEEQASLLLSSEISVTRWPPSRAEWLRNRDLRARFQEIVRRINGLHIHGLWENSTNIAAWTARSFKKPYIISAHGMLEPWALANKGIKKRIYSALIERRNIEGAACLHALTLAEAEDYRRFGSQKPIAVIPNGVNIPTTIRRQIFFDNFPELRGGKIVLFLGRIHFKKGLDILVRAWATLEKRFSDAVLVLAGPDSEDSRATVEELIVGLGLSPRRVVFTGMLDEETKWSALANAHCFVLPSYSEGLSVATLEAMGMGVPVIISENCHMPEVKDLGAGWVIKTDVFSLSEALEEVLQNKFATNAKIGNCGRKIVADRYTWSAVGNQMAKLYHWIQDESTELNFELLGGRS